MKLTIKLEAEILKVYYSYWDAYLKGDMKTFASFLDKNISVYGTAVSEVFDNKKETVRFYKATADQMTGKAQFRNRKIRLQPLNDTVLTNEQCDLYVLIDNIWTFYSHARITGLFQQTKSGWKLVHQHGSFPDSRTDEGDQIAAEKIKEENLQLREAVKRRTVELESKNRELEIETALEKVRTVAMGMRKPDDMLEVCRIISQQSESLGIKEIRNVQTAIIYEDKGTYLNYEYYTKHDKLLVTEVDYKNHELQSLFANQMLRGAEELFSSALAGKEVQDWYEYQKTTNQYADSYLENARSLDYYFYSLGPVALGMSTYKPLNEEGINLFKRFRNVFDLAYRRFLDIEQAEAQAREAKIEASLERVRAQALSMRKPDDLPGICEVLFTELTTLGFSEIRNAMINIHNDEKASFVNYDYSDEIGQSINHLQYNIHPLIEKQVKQVRSAADAFSVTSFEKKDLEDWIAFRKKIGEKDDPRIENTDALYYYFYSIGTGSIGISTFSSITEEKLGVLKRFRNVFDFAYRRYTDVAQAEAQAREAQIELGLERVRARAMAMRTSEELAQLVDTVFKELTKLHFLLDRCIIMIYDPKTNGSTWWMANPEPGFVPVGLFVKYHNQRPYLEYIKAWKARTLRWEYLLEGSSKKEWDNYIFSETELSLLPELVIVGMKSVKQVFLNASFNNFGSITASTVEHLPEEQFDILLRFAKVFDMTYTRFNDLKQAEAQAREAQIELGLERVRARAMAMQNSNELAELVATLFKELTRLDFALTRCYIYIIDPDTLSLRAWTFNTEVDEIPESYNIQYLNLPYYKALIRAWKERNQKFVYELGGEEKQEVDRVLLNETEYIRLPEAVKTGMMAADRVFLSYSFNNFGGLQTGGLEPLSDENLDIFSRFGKVFDLTYTRFNDLKQAEAQARESQIQLAMERVRARTMAMHKSEELAELSLELVKQVQALGIATWFCAFNITDEDAKSSMEWGSNGQGTFPKYRTHREGVFLRYYNAGQSGETLLINEIGENECAAHYEYLCSLPGVGDQLLKMKDAGIPFPKSQIDHVAFFKYGYIIFITYEPVPEAHDIFMRFAKVFEQTYTRFLDLQKAEAQVRESQVEAALERVRSRTMGMQHSDELQEAAVLLFQQVVALGVPAFGSGFNIWDDDRKYATAWMGGQDRMQPPFKTSSSEDIFLRIFEAAQKGESLFVEEQGGEALKSHYKYLNSILVFKEIADKMTLAGQSFPTFQIIHCAFFSQGYLMFISFESVPYAYDIFKRFAKVFEQTYTRFLDLQKAEAQARESQIEAALERVRSRTMAMQKSDELAETSAVLFQQLIQLGIEPNRLYITIIKDDEANSEFWITDEDGSKVSSAFETNLNNNPVFRKMLGGWKEKKNSLTIDMKGEELQEYFQYLSSLHVPFKGGLAQTRRIQYIGYFNKGFIGMASPVDQPEETIQLLARFAAVFNLTFTRFNDLKIAEANAIKAEEDLVKLQTEKQRAEEALAEFQVTQKQLIQSEKMASLGELTAGIAHEIQNPLNFVNNFSEVSNELLDEMKTELDNGDIQEAKAIASDVKINLEKILHHGKRADAIVKGMLQHSRSNSGIKEPTNINALAEEYLRLAYHGLRAKDKSFNAALNTDFDESIGKIDVVPQDIGRVILNLITNAFYAVNEKKKLSGPDYKPTVSVSTRKTIDKVELLVTDNGNGIPQKIVEKIFQPFFTTKPAGEGTGLGLSLSYDIVKAHGGELKVESEVDSGSGKPAFTNFSITLPQPDN